MKTMSRKKMNQKMTNKSLEYYLSLPYTIELTPDEDGYWFAAIPLLKGCMTQGESREDALVMLNSGWKQRLKKAFRFQNPLVSCSSHKAGSWK